MPGIDYYTIMCLHCDGTAGSSTFSDASSSPKTVVAIADTVTESSNFKFGNAAMNLNSSVAGVTTGGSSQFEFGTGDFTVDTWVYLTATSTIGYIYDARAASSNGWSATLRISTAATMTYQTASTIRITSSAVTTGSWFHVALVHSGTSTWLFLNGAQTGVTFSDTGVYINDTAGQRPILGGNANAVGFNGLGGAMDEIRVSLTARWSTAGFSPPAQPYDNALGFNNSYVSKTEVFNCKPDSVGY